jgi:ribose 5-phosphate isomerase B
MKGSRELVVALAADQAGLALKSHLASHLRAEGHMVLDLGTFSDDPVDYPDYAEKVAVSVVTGESNFGIAICGTGIGMSIAANKVTGIRAALCSDTLVARRSREHEDANVLALGAWVVTPQRAEEILGVWLASEYEGGRHVARLAKIRSLETRNHGAGPVREQTGA